MKKQKTPEQIIAFQEKNKKYTSLFVQGLNRQVARRIKEKDEKTNS